MSESEWVGSIDGYLVTLQGINDVYIDCGDIEICTTIDELSKLVDELKESRENKRIENWLETGEFE